MSCRLAPPPELDAASSDMRPSLHPAPQQVPVYVYPTRGERFRSFAKAFALGCGGGDGDHRGSRRRAR